MQDPTYLGAFAFFILLSRVHTLQYALLATPDITGYRAYGIVAICDARMDFKTSKSRY